MTKINEAIDRIKALECPTGDIENRVAGILEDYGVAKRNNVNVVREDKLDREGAQGYRSEITNEGQSIVVLAEAGSDDYVAKVVNVYLK